MLELGSKAGRKELNEQWKVLRRGWYVDKMPDYEISTNLHGSNDSRHLVPFS